MRMESRTGTPPDAWRSKFRLKDDEMIQELSEILAQTGETAAESQ